MEGCAALFHLFQPMDHENEPLSTELCRFISKHCLGLINTQSCQGWNMLHRAAAYATAKDIEFCVNSGASLDLVISDYSWNPLFVAVTEGNVETYNELALHHYGPDHVNHTDARGWTLLHLAAEVGNSQLVHLLVKRGSDLDARTPPGMQLVEDEIRNLSVTALEVAKYYGEEKLNSFIRGLRLAGVDVAIHSQDVYWPCNDSN